MGWFENAINPVGYATGQLFGGDARQLANYGNAPGLIENYNNNKKKNDEAANAPALTGDNAAARAADINAGNAAGRQIFYDDPEMQMLKAKREEFAKGYDGKELGGIRQEARGQVAGQRSAYLQSLQGKLARAGVGGARAAALNGAADQNYARMGNEAERKLSLDSATMKRKGSDDLQQFIMNQKYGQLGTGLAYAQLGATDRGSAAAAQANRPQRKGALGNLLDGIL